MDAAISSAERIGWSAMRLTTVVATERVWAGVERIDRANQQWSFWLFHGLFQVLVVFALCLPWIERIGT